MVTNNSKAFSKDDSGHPVTFVVLTHGHNPGSLWEQTRTQGQWGGSGETWPLPWERLVTELWITPDACWVVLSSSGAWEYVAARLIRPPMCHKCKADEHPTKPGIWSPSPACVWVLRTSHIYTGFWRKEEKLIQSIQWFQTCSPVKHGV